MYLMGWKMECDFIEEAINLSWIRGKWPNSLIKR